MAQAADALAIELLALNIEGQTAPAIDDLLRRYGGNLRVPTLKDDDRTSTDGPPLKRRRISKHHEQRTTQRSRRMSRAGVDGNHAVSTLNEREQSRNRQISCSIAHAGIVTCGFRDVFEHAEFGW